MNITTDEIQKALRIKKAVTEYFYSSKQTKVMAKDLMTLFISKGIFPKDHQEGFPIREFLRQLDEKNHLHLIPQIHIEPKQKNNNWFFINTNK